MRYIQLIITGKVQGVFYRASAKKVADELGVSGWVRNTSNGGVEILAGGDEEALERFIDWCHRGPAKAIVQAMEINPVQPQSFDGFRIVR